MTALYPPVVVMNKKMVGPLSLGYSQQIVKALSAVIMVSREQHDMIKKPRLEAVEEISKNYKVKELSEEECGHCEACYPANFDIDTTEDLWESAPAARALVLVATGQRNWKHNICDEDTTWGKTLKLLSEASEQFEAICGGYVRVNGTDQDFEGLDEGKAVVTVLPQFLRIVTTPEAAVERVLEVLRTEPTANPPEDSQLVVEKGFILLCSHAQRDKRCGISAPILRKQLEMELRHAELYRPADDDLDEVGEPEGVRVLYINHVGGHKYAANALIYMKDGTALMLARLRPEHARLLVENTVQKGIVYPEFVRSCTRLRSYSW